MSKKANSANLSYNTKRFSASINTGMPRISRHRIDVGQDTDVVARHP